MVVTTRPADGSSPILGFEELWETAAVPDSETARHSSSCKKYDVKSFAENYMVRLNVKNLDAWWQAVSGLQLEKKYPGFRIKGPAEFPWGREVNFIDLAGVCWHVGSA